MYKKLLEIPNKEIKTVKNYQSPTESILENSIKKNFKSSTVIIDDQQINLADGIFFYLPAYCGEEYIQNGLLSLLTLIKKEEQGNSGYINYTNAAENRLKAMLDKWNTFLKTNKDNLPEKLLEILKNPGTYDIYIEYFFLVELFYPTEYSKLTQNNFFKKAKDTILDFLTLATDKEHGLKNSLLLLKNFYPFLELDSIKINLKLIHHIDQLNNLGAFKMNEAFSTTHMDKLKEILKKYLLSLSDN